MVHIKVRTCKQCSSEFARKRGPQGDFCSRPCYDKYRRVLTLHDIKCATCDSQFSTYQKRKYCSMACYPTNITETKTCANCSKVFLGRLSAKFCSTRCNMVFQHDKPAKSKKCLICSMVFVPHCKNGMKFCSDSCRAANKAAKDHNRAAKRRAVIEGTKHTKVDTASVISDAKGICECCKKPTSKEGGRFSEAYPNIDHIIPISRGGVHNKANLQLLCRKCNMSKGNRLPVQMAKVYLYG